MEGHPRKRRSPSNNITYDNDVWELYNDFNKPIDLAKKNPEKLKELKALFDVFSRIGRYILRNLSAMKLIRKH